MNHPEYPPEEPCVATPVQPDARVDLPWVEPVIHTISGKPIERLTRAKAILGEQYWSMLGFCLLGMLIGSLLPFGILMGPVLCGLHICYAECRTGRKATFDHLMKGTDYFGDSVIAMLIMVGCTMLVTIPLFVLAVILFVGGMGLHEVGEGSVTVIMIVAAIFVYLLGILASFLAYIPFVFVFPLIVDRKMTGIQAVKLSAKAAWQNFWPVTWFMFGNFLSSMVAAFMCYIPAILLMPLNFASTFELYYEVFEWNEKKTVAGNQ